MNKTDLVIATFIITALWDVILRWFSEDRFPHLPAPLNVHEYDFVVALRPYFKKHTLLGAALLAGIIGAIFQLIMLQFFSMALSVPFFIASFVLAGSLGFPMKWSGLFPILHDTYYKTLGSRRAFYTDAMSGIIVQLTLIVLIYLRKHVMNKI
tara:strand:+ start:2655 stop:3113 length:459 start_codon:yes stop_codon:yes gene_type:complete